MKKQPIKLYDNETHERSLDVDAYVFDDFAIHTFMGGKLWRITHMGTGKRLPQEYQRLSDAKAVIAKIQGMYDWGSVKKGDKDMGSRVMDVIYEHCVL